MITLISIFVLGIIQPSQDPGPSLADTVAYLNHEAAGATYYSGLADSPNYYTISASLVWTQDGHLKCDQDTCYPMHTLVDGTVVPEWHKLDHYDVDFAQLAPSSCICTDYHRDSDDDPNPVHVSASLGLSTSNNKTVILHSTSYTGTADPVPSDDDNKPVNNISIWIKCPDDDKGSSPYSQRVQKAVRHLVELCGGKDPVSSDPFDGGGSTGGGSD